MKHRRPGSALAAAVLLAAGAIAIAPLAAQEEPPPAKTLMPGKGYELTMARCVTCHDATHITRARLSRGEWEFNIRNMIERGAPIAPDEIPAILEYLATYYNRDQPPPVADAAASGPPQDAAEKLLAAHGCIACHQTDRRVVGPSFREVAARFATDADGAPKLARKIREGGAGNWGNVPMPPHAGVPEADIARMVDWVLAQK